MDAAGALGRFFGAARSPGGPFGAATSPRWLAGAARSARRPLSTTSAKGTIEALCRDRGIPIFRVRGINSRAGRDRLRALGADLLVCAGTPILGERALRLARLGAINAHMALLPRFRGMSAAEWAALAGAPAGVTVHLVDRGVDTGPILAIRTVDVRGAVSVDALRRRLDAEQNDLLAAVAQALVVERRTLTARIQRSGDGIQLFPMHGALRQVLEERLASRRSREWRPLGRAA